MPRPRTPQAKAEVTGRIVHDAGRYKARSTPPVAKLGKPYARMTPSEAAHWNELAAELPWLASSDRRAVEQLCQLLAEADDLRSQGECVPQNLRAQIRMYLNSFGGTPADRSKISAPEEKKDDPADKYIL